MDDLNKGLLDVFILGYRYHQNGRPDVYGDITDEKLKDELIQNFEKFSTIVILDDNIVVGYLSYIIKSNNCNKIHIDQLVIDEKYRGKGLGKRLIDEVKNIASKNNCDRIELDCWMFNENALAMYEHIGFEKQRIIYEMKIENRG